MELHAYCDGAAEPNPGPSSWGYVLKDPDGGIVGTGCGYLGHGTNNQAEYQAVLHAIDAARKFEPEGLYVYTDSKLVVEQLLGNWKIKNPQLAVHRRAVLAAGAGLVVDYRWIPREENTDADALTLIALQREGLGGRAQGARYLRRGHPGARPGVAAR